MRRFLTLFSLAVLAVSATLAMAPQPASAATINLVATINRAAASSTCPGPGPGTGSATLTYDDVTNMLSWNITFSGMSGPPTVAHFHGPATPAQDAGVQVTIGDLTSPSIGSATLTAGQETDLLNDLWYINYHTSMCSGGEIRGQVVQSVGGVAELPGVESSPLEASQGSGSNVGLIAGMTAAAIAAASMVATGAWLLRRRVQD